MATNNSISARACEKSVTSEKTINEIGTLFDVAHHDCMTAKAIINAVTVLCALERAPAHHDAHPSHNIITGAGYAHGLRVFSDTLPKLLALAEGLVESAANDFDVMREQAIIQIGRLQEGGAA